MKLGDRVMTKDGPGVLEHVEWETVYEGRRPLTRALFYVRFPDGNLRLYLNAHPDQ